MTSPRTVQLRSWCAGAAGDQGAGEVEVRTPGGPPPRRRPSPARPTSTSSPTSAIGGRSSTRGAPTPTNRSRIARTPGAVLTARRAERAAQVLLVDDHVAERAGVVRPHPVAERLGDGLPLGDQRRDVLAAPGLHLTAVHVCCGRPARHLRRRPRPARPCARGGRARSSPGRPAPAAARSGGRSATRSITRCWARPTPRRRPRAHPTTSPPPAPCLPRRRLDTGKPLSLTAWWPYAV